MPDVPVTLIGDTRYLTAPRAATVLGISRQRVHQLIQRGALPSLRVGGMHYVPEDAVLARSTVSP